MARNKEDTFKSFSSEELEKKLVEAHEQQGVLNSIKEKYLVTMNKDVKDSEFLREQAHNRVRNNI